MLVQLFAFVICLCGVALALMCQDLPEHRRLAAGMEVAKVETVAATPDGVVQAGADQTGVASAAPVGALCDGLRGKSRRDCQRDMVAMDADFSEPQEAPRLD